jgi:hypothetical protein
MSTSAISRAAGHLARGQLPHGEFPSHRYASPSLVGAGQPDSSPFVTSLVLYSLGFVDTPEVPSMVERGLAFLLSEREEPGVWRYWTSRNASRVDPDVDDTCCVSFVLRQHGLGARVEGNEALLLANRTDRGVFKTWLREPLARNDVDSVVNANALLYLGEREETRTACDVLNWVIQQGHEERSTWYYLDALVLHYMASRALYHGVRGLERSREAMLARLGARQREDGSFGDELATAMGLCTLLNLGLGHTPMSERARRHLLRTQQEDGSWRRSPFYCGPEPPGPRSVWWGSEALTTALCLEALARCPASGG